MSYKEILTIVYSIKEMPIENCVEAMKKFAESYAARKASDGNNKRPPESHGKLQEAEKSGEQVKKPHNFWCEECRKRATPEATSISEASKAVRARGWSVRAGLRLGMVVGLWTCPECQGKGAKR
jgi:hypothetical protein